MAYIFIGGLNLRIFIYQGNSPSISNTSNSTKKKQDARKMWVQVKATGDMLEINLDKDRPVKFDSKDAEVSTHLIMAFS